MFVAPFSRVTRWNQITNMMALGGAENILLETRSYRVPWVCIFYGLIYIIFLRLIFMTLNYVCRSECRCLWRPEAMEPLGQRLLWGSDKRDGMVIKLRSSAREVPAPNSGAISPPFSTFLSKV